MRRHGERPDQRTGADDERTRGFACVGGAGHDARPRDSGRTLEPPRDRQESLMSAHSGRRFQRITQVLWAILVLNLVVAAAKILYGMRIGAIALSADGVHSLLDASGNVVALIGIAAARRPPDANHPYGHRKYETVAALGVAAMMFFGCYELVLAGMERVRHATPPVIPVAAFAVLALTLMINLIVVSVETREGRELQSELLLADAAHTRSDVFASLLVLVSFGAARLHVPYADAAAAGMIVVLILYAGFELLRGTLSTLSDERRIAPELIEQTTLEEPGVLEAHNVRSRGPLDDIHVDLHILVDPQLSLAAAHALGHRVERRLRERWLGLTDVVVHVEPALESERAKAREGGGLKAED
jgi:cation diffusion facilitator family transporter